LSSALILSSNAGRPAKAEETATLREESEEGEQRGGSGTEPDGSVAVLVAVGDRCPVMQQNVGGAFVAFEHGGHQRTVALKARRRYKLKGGRKRR
jgi:hypothetical protein